MLAEKLSWVGYEIPTREARWICAKSRSMKSPASPDKLEYFLEFAAHDKQIITAPDTRTLRLCTSEYLVGTNLPYLRDVVKGQMMETKAWDRVVEVYNKV